MAIRCETCGKEHIDELPDLGMHAPDPYLDVPEDERADRTVFTPDRCIVVEDDGESHYFVRGVIFIPVIGQTRPFGLGAWVSQSERNYDRYADGEDMEPTYGWLVNRFPHYAKDTFLLQASLIFSNADGVRPTIVLEPSDHPLVIEQRTGITLARAWQIVHRYLPN